MDINEHNLRRVLDMIISILNPEQIKQLEDILANLEDDDNTKIQQ
ncbi:MAG TPA: hypothetical protein VIR31_05920 [Nitrososphaeraceae archaeon]